MKILAIKTRRVLPGIMTITELLDESLEQLNDRSIVVVTSKVVALCENNVVPIEGTDREQLIKDEAQLYYFPEKDSEHRYHFTIKQRTLIPASGIDASNTGGYYVLWPKDSIATAGVIRQHLMKKHDLTSLGVIITDSTIGLSRWGTFGIAIGHSGFEPVKDYIGQPDLFGRPLSLTKANIAGGLAAAAVLVMGEGAEQTPLAIIEKADSVEFWPKDQNEDSPGIYYISPLDDEPFQPFFNKVEWQRGGTKRDQNTL